MTWNTLPLLKTCLSSVEKNTTLKDYEIIIINNNSQDGTRDFLETIDNNRYHFIFNSENRGVGPARNQGIEIANGEYILILDVDTIVTQNAIDRLVKYLDNNPECGIVAPRLTDINGSLQYTCRDFPTIVSKFLRRMTFKWAKEMLAKEEQLYWDHNTVKEVDYVIGACQLIRKSVIKMVGLLDDNIFYGPEDIDYCLRVWQAGYKVVYNPEAVIIHDEQRITRRNMFTRIGWRHSKGLLYYFWKHKYLFSRKRLYKTIPYN